MSASKLGELSEGNEPEKSKPAEAKGTARALVAAEKELAREQLRAKQSDSSAQGLPSPAERRKILERASSLIAEARSLLERIEGGGPVSSRSPLSSRSGQNRTSDSA